MWKKRSILLLLALTMACSSTLYGCDVMKIPTESGANASEENSGETSGEDKDSGGADKTDSNGKEKSEDAKGGLSAEKCNALWKEYLGQQTLCHLHWQICVDTRLLPIQPYRPARTYQCGNFCHIPPLLSYSCAMPITPVTFSLASSQSKYASLTSLLYYTADRNCCQYSISRSIDYAVMFQKKCDKTKTLWKTETFLLCYCIIA